MLRELFCKALMFAIVILAMPTSEVISQPPTPGGPGAGTPGSEPGDPGEDNGTAMCWFDAGRIRCHDAVVVLYFSGELTPDHEIGQQVVPELLISCGDCVPEEVEQEEPPVGQPPVNPPTPNYICPTEDSLLFLASEFTFLDFVRPRLPQDGTASGNTGYNEGEVVNCGVLKKCKGCVFQQVQTNSGEIFEAWRCMAEDFAPAAPLKSRSIDGNSAGCQ